MQIYGSLDGKKFTSTFVANAAMLLSITSAIAASTEYPMLLVDSIRIGAYGGISIVLINILLNL